MTAGRWSWKLKSAKKCVIDNMPNGLELKMDGAKAQNLPHAVGKRTN
jgi:hypothetical protein